MLGDPKPKKLEAFRSLRRFPKATVALGSLPDSPFRNFREAKMSCKTEF